MDVASAGVQVVTVSDWPAIVAAISGGIVGIAGVAAAIWTAKRTITAESDRTRVAEKRRIYAACLAAINELIPALAEYRVLRGGDDADGRHAAWRETIRARTAFANIVGEVELIAPPQITELARQAVAYFWDYSEATRQGASVADPLPTASGVFIRLRRAMRADLGESVGPIEAEEPAQQDPGQPSEG